MSKPTIREQIKKILFPNGYEVVYPEDESEDGYPKINAIESLISQSVIEARFKELGTVDNLADGLVMPNVVSEYIHDTRNFLAQELKTLANKGGES